jgi:2-polyprenyl-3-methyl-5-hydroxy-6-metoxy-1,4-benzoquinol methylase/uncharacterized protein YbaR (Trm112 family)
VWHQLLQKPRVCRGGQDTQKASLLGPSYAGQEVEEFLRETQAVSHACPQETDLLERVAQALAEGKVVGWFHGRAEYGPRALGARSILGDARSPSMQAVMNLKIKFREGFRPFAPVVLREHVHEWFGMRPNEDSPYMLLVAPVNDERRVPLSEADQRRLAEDPDLTRRVNVVRSTVPAITHVDYSARVQTVDERHGRYYRLLKRFHEKTGCPVLVNTSFNLSWEPIVLTPAEAYHTFMQSAMDVLVLEDHILYKAEQPLGLDLALASEGPATYAEQPWADPRTGDPLVVHARMMHNPVTDTWYPIEDGIPRLFVPTSDVEANGKQDMTPLVQQFYEKTPFPNYEDVDTSRALLEKARAGLFARLLNEQIPYGARVVEIGCGTGQLTNFLAIANRTMLGVDVCLNSLRLAQKFKMEQGLDRARFAQMNLFRPGLRDCFFDYVISNGVRHHTADCRAAFRRISKLARPGGFVIVGLYNSYSRQIHYARRALHRWTGLTSRWMDRRFRTMKAARKREVWFQDQYCHPHETCHTLDELLSWMEESDLEFVNSIPKPVPGPVLTEDEHLFEPRSPGTALSRCLSQLADLRSDYREGGFFLVIGRKRGNQA